LELVEKDLAKGLRAYPARSLVLLLDFDGREDRRTVVGTRIPAALRDRTYLFGVWTEPEELGQERESFGASLAQACYDGAEWNHPLLAHNAEEVARAAGLRGALFG